MRINSVNIINFGRFDYTNVKKTGPSKKEPVSPVIVYKAETPDQLAALDKYREAKNAYNAIKDDKTVDWKEKDHLKKVMDDLDIAYKKSLGMDI